jgi:hypothetical protein
MSRRGPLSIEDHRDWIARFGEWTPPTRRPGEKLVDHVMGRLSTALGRSEAELLKDVVARVDFNEAERARVGQWAREALTIAVLSAERAGSSGTRLSDNVLFHELALRWSPTYVKARECGPGRFPSEMKRATLQAARDDLKAAGFRLQPLFAIVTQAVAGWYKTRTTAKGRRVVLRGRPLKGEALKEARALLGLPPLERVRGHLLRHDDPPHSIHRRIETTDPEILEAERILGKDLLLAVPPSLGSYTLVADAKVTAETEFEPIRSGPRARAVVRILDETRLVLDVRAARVELARLWRKLKAARTQVAVVVHPHKKVNATKRIVMHQVAGSITKNIHTTVEYKGQILSEKKTTRTMKRIHTEDVVQQTEQQKNVWFPPWSTAEIAALEAKRSVEQQYRALKPVVRSLERKTGEVIIKTQHRQLINRRWHPSSFWMEDLPGDSSTEREYIPETYDSETGEADEGSFDLVTKARGRLFRVIRRSEHGRGRTFGGDKLEGVDVSSSQYQILAILLNDEELEKALADKSAHQITADRVYPGDSDGPNRAKLVLVAGGYGSAPDRISWKKNIPLEEVQQVLSSLGPNIGKYLEYTREVAYAVDAHRGFRFIDPFDESVVVWHPIVAEPDKVGSDKVQLMTYVPANGGAVNHKKLAQQIAPMLIHALDSAFSGLVVEGLHRRGVKDIVALFDCWLIPSHFLSEYKGNPYLFADVIKEASAAWLPMLGPIYDALLEYKGAVSEPEWMESLKEAWHTRVKERRWPLFRTKRITTYGYE